MQIKTLKDFMMPAFIGFIEKNKADIASMQPGSWMKIFFSESQIKGLIKDKEGNKTRLRKVIVRYK